MVRKSYDVLWEKRLMLIGHYRPHLVIVFG
jgi:hypothetical protein